MSSKRSLDAKLTMKLLTCRSKENRIWDRVNFSPLDLSHHEFENFKLITPYLFNPNLKGDK